MSKCNFLPESDKKYMAMTRHIKGLLNDCDESEEEEDNYNTEPQDNYVEVTYWYLTSTRHDQVQPIFNAITSKNQSPSH